MFTEKKAFVRIVFLIIPLKIVAVFLTANIYFLNMMALT